MVSFEFQYFFPLLPNFFMLVIDVNMFSGCSLAAVVGSQVQNLVVI